MGVQVLQPPARKGLTFADRGLPFSGVPRGWYQAAWSAELAVGDVRPLRCFDRELVIYRSTGGQAHVLDAFCGHYGAHLGHGGTVEGSSIRCPYHGWLWNGEGRNVEVPYGDGRCANRVLRTWPVVEASGIIFIWYSPDRSSPNWDPPSLPVPEDRGYFALYPGGTHEELVCFPAQYVVENMADLAHLKFVHRFEEIPELLHCAPDGHRFKTVFQGQVPGRGGYVHMVLTQEAYGLGLILTETADALETVGLTAMTPVDQTSMVMRFSRWVKCDDPTLEGQQPTGRALRYIQNNVGEALKPDGDRRIWENMRYPSNPGPIYTRDEARSLRLVRKWTEQFYSGTKTRDDQSDARVSVTSERQE
jgi:3-ketosteroid 9alpha-monooxygenase subunit A